MSRMLRRLPGLLGLVLTSPVRLYLAVLDVGARKLQARQQAIRERPPLDDADFVESLDLPQSQHAIAIAVRDVVSSACGVPFTALRSDDHLDQLEQLPELLGPPIDWSDLLEQIAEQAEIKIPARRFDERSWGRVGRNEYVADLKHLISAIIAQATPLRSGPHAV